MTMNSDHPHDEVVARALDALLATPGPDDPPADTVRRVRAEIAARQATPTAGKAASTRRRDRVSWLALAITILLMLAGAWTWSGVATMTASIFLSSLSNITRKSL